MKKRVAFIVGQYPPAERKRREDVALSYATSEVEVGIVSLAGTPYIHGFTPAELSLVAPVMMQAYREAERQGYDAIVPLGFLDIGVDGGRSVVDIPIIGPMESSLHLGSMLGDRLGMIIYKAEQKSQIAAIASRYRMDDRICGWADSGFELPDIAENRDAMIENFVRAARLLIERDGAEVIIPTGITQCPVHIDPRWLAKELGVPVVEGIGAPIRLAAMFADLGLMHCRRRWPKSTSLP